MGSQRQLVTYEWNSIRKSACRNIQYFGWAPASCMKNFNKGSKVVRDTTVYIKILNILHSIFFDEKIRSRPDTTKKFIRVGENQF